jgi:hypothetical protein
MVEETRKKKAIDFGPFGKYFENRSLLTKHLAATELAYGLAVATFADPKLKAPKVKIKSKLKKPDKFTMADILIGEPTRKFGWVSLEEYAKLENTGIALVQSQADTGLLGKVERHPKKNIPIVLWPLSIHGTNEASGLELGNSRWNVPISMPQTVSIAFDDDDPACLPGARKKLISHGRGLGKPSKVYTEASELTFRSSFLNLWSAFEVFLRETFSELIRQFPGVLSKLTNGKRPTISYEALVDGTAGFSNLDSFREALIAKEIANIEASGNGVHGIINSLKTLFKWNDDLYKNFYREKRKNHQTGYVDLAEIKAVRNALTHQIAAKDEDYKKSSRLKFKDSRIAMDREYLDWADLVLTAIAHGISEQIMKEKVKYES